MTLRSSLLLRLRSALQRLFGVSGWQSMLLWSIVAGLLGTLATELFRATLRGFEHLVLGPGDSLVAMARALPGRGPGTRTAGLFSWGSDSLFM